MKMTERKRPFATRLGPENRFGIAVAPAANFRAAEPSEFERLKERLLHEHLDGETQPEIVAALHRAANDAAGLAWTMPLPLLVLPELFREKASDARRYARRQTALRRNQRPASRTPEVAA